MYQGSGQGTYVPTMVPPPGYVGQMPPMSGTQQQVGGVYNNPAMMGMPMNQQTAYMHPQQMMWGAQVPGNYMAGVGNPPVPEPEPDMYETSVYLGIEDVDGFNVRDRVIGEKGENLEYMRRNTQAKVLLRGKGSGVHSNRPLHIFISHPSLQGMQETEKLANNLVKVVKEDYADFVAKKGEEIYRKDNSRSQQEISYSGSRNETSYGVERSINYGHQSAGNQMGSQPYVFDYGHSRGSSGSGDRSMSTSMSSSMATNMSSNINTNMNTNMSSNMSTGYDQRRTQDTRDSNFGPRQSRFDVRTSNFGNIGNGNDRSRTMHEKISDRSMYAGSSSVPSRSQTAEPIMPRDRGANVFSSGKPQNHYCDICSIDCPTRQMYNLHCKGAMHREKEVAMMRQLSSPPRAPSFSKDLEGTHWEGPPAPQHKSKGDAKGRDYESSSESTMEEWLFKECEKRIKLMIGEGPLNHLKRLVEKIGQRDLKAALPTSQQSDIYCKLCKMDVVDMKQHLTVKSHGSLYLLRQIQLGELFLEYYSDVPIPGVITNGGRVLAMDTLTFGPCIPEAKRERFKELLVYSGAYLAYKCSVCTTKIPSLGQWVHHITSKKHGKNCVEAMIRMGSTNFRYEHMNIPIPPPKNALDLIKEIEITDVHPTVPRRRQSLRTAQQTGNSFQQLSSLSPSERQLVLQVQVLTGIGDLSVITGVLAALESMDPGMLQTLSSMNPEAVMQAMTGSGALQGMDVSVVQKVIKTYACFKGISVEGKNPESFQMLALSNIEQSKKKGRQQDKGRSRWDDNPRKSNDDRKDRKDSQSRGRSDRRDDRKDDRGRSDRSKNDNKGSSSGKPSDKSKDTERSRQEKRKGDKVDDSKSKKSCPPSKGKDKKNSDKEKSTGASVIDLTSDETPDDATEKAKTESKKPSEKPEKTEKNDGSEGSSKEDNVEKEKDEEKEENTEGKEEKSPTDKEKDTDGDKDVAESDEKKPTVGDDAAVESDDKTAIEDEKEAAKPEDKETSESEDKEAVKTEDKEAEAIEEKEDEKMEDKVDEKSAEEEKSDDKEDEKTEDEVAVKAEDKEDEKVEVREDEKAEDDVPVKTEDKKDEKMEVKEDEKAEDKEDEKVEVKEDEKTENDEPVKTEDKEDEKMEVKEDEKAEDEVAVKAQDKEDEKMEVKEDETTEDEVAVKAEDKKDEKAEDEEMKEGEDKEAVKADKENTNGESKEEPESDKPKAEAADKIPESEDKKVAESDDTKDTDEKDVVKSDDKGGNESMTEEKDAEIPSESAEDQSPAKKTPTPRGRRGRRRGRGRGGARGSPRTTRTSLRSKKPGPTEEISLDQFETVDEYVAEEEAGEPPAKKVCTEEGEETAADTSKENKETTEKETKEGEKKDAEMEDELAGGDNADDMSEIEDISEMEEALLGSEEEEAAIKAAE